MPGTCSPAGPGGLRQRPGRGPRPRPRRALGPRASLGGGRATRCNLSSGRAEHRPCCEVYPCSKSRFVIRKINTSLQTSDLEEVLLVRALLLEAKQHQDGNGCSLLPSPPSPSEAALNCLQGFIVQNHPTPAAEPRFPTAPLLSAKRLPN